MSLALQTGDTILPFIGCFGIFRKRKYYIRGGGKSAQFFLITGSPSGAIETESGLI